MVFTGGVEVLADGSTSQFSGEGIMPWHGLCKPTPGLGTAAEVLKKAHLDWKVEKRQIFFADYNPDKKTATNLTKYDDRFATVRVTDDRALGIVSANYHIFQNVEAFEFMDAITDAGTGEAHYTSAGSLSGGQRVFLCVRLSEGIMVAGEDAHDQYLLITNSHDGTQAFTAAVVIIRVDCTNTCTLALKSAKTKWSIRHKTDLKGKVQEAREQLKMSWNYRDKFQEEIEKFLAVDINADKMLAIAEAIVPPSKFQHDKAVKGIMNVFENEKTVNETNFVGTGYAAFNAVTYWSDWVRNYQTEDARFKSLVGAGFAETLRDKAHRKILAYG